LILKSNRFYVEKLILYSEAKPHTLIRDGK